MDKLLGLKGKSREMLAILLRGTMGTMTIDDACRLLNIPPEKARKYLSRWAQQGWISRISRGVYIPVPIDANRPDIAIEDPWIIASALFSPIYVGGWTAAHHWELTEQLFRAIVVFTTRSVRDRNPTIRDVPFIIHTAKEKKIFGTSTVWRNDIKIQVSNPTRTILDILNNFSVGGGLIQGVEIFRNYMDSEHKNLELLIKQISKFGNKTLFKRLGYLLEKLFPNEQKIISICKDNLSQGNSKLDPHVNSNKLVTRWKLWVPDKWHKGVSNDT